MELSGKMVILAPRLAVEQAIQSPATLKAILPACREVRQLSPGNYVAKLEYIAGPVPIRIEAKITVIPRGPGVFRMVVKGGTLVTGNVNVETDITLKGEPTGCKLTYSGAATATGLAKHLMNAKQAALLKRTNMMFLKLKAQIESQKHRPGA